MEPQIQYAHSDDGVSIAFWTLGEGEPPLVILPPLVASHIALEWQYSPLRAWYESLAARRKIVRFDWRGQGLSERHITDISLGPLLSDLDAVTQRLGLPRYALFSSGTRWQVAVAGAVRHPDRVSHLVILNPVEMRVELTPQTRARREMFHADWEEYTEILARSFLDRSSARVAPLYAQFIRQAIDPEVWGLLFDIAETRAWEIRDRLDDVRAPALVIMPTTTDEGSKALAQRLASQIPDGRLLVAPGGSDSEFGVAGVSADTEEAIDNFLGGAREGASEIPSGMTAILFADIADSTALTERIGDTAFRQKARVLDDALRANIREHGGTVIEGKLLGDGILATFPAASQAIAAALTLGAAAAPTGLGLHIGLHACDVTREVDADGRNNVFGGAVNIASRISALAAPGQVLVSRTVADLARTSAGVTFEDRGEHALKGIADAVRVFAVRRTEGADGAAH